LIAAHDARLKAVMEGDLEALRKVVGEDMIYVSATGQARTRAEVFAAFSSGALKMNRMEASEVQTRLYGDVGILIYKADAKFVDGGVTVEGQTRSTTIYARRNGGWEMISQHQSEIA
ncbi:MAG: nuclear transport factor 2 family protein, partial [Alphaproteobacteria bacterium]|nr:nuclear transport factor 2 family protein [Alphaproteobacteria bacterium]